MFFRARSLWCTVHSTHLSLSAYERSRQHNNNTLDLLIAAIMHRGELVQEGHSPDQCNLLELYKDLCSREGCRVNSSVVQYMEAQGPAFVPLKLDLGHNYLGAKGLRPIIQLISACQTITEVDLGGNGADNSTVEALCGVLRGHLGVTSVNLGRNPITVVGGRMLLQLLEDNRRITRMDVRGTDIFESLQERITLVANANFLNAQRHAQLVAGADATEVDKLLKAAATRPPVTRQRKQLPRVCCVAAAAVSGRDGIDRVSESLPAIRRASVAADSPPVSHRLASTEAAMSVNTTRSTVAAGNGRLPPAQLQALRQKFDERARLLAEVKQSEASRMADVMRRELRAMEQSSKSAPTESPQRLTALRVTPHHSDDACEAAATAVDECTDAPVPSPAEVGEQAVEEEGLPPLAPMVSQNDNDPTSASCDNVVNFSGAVVEQSIDSVPGFDVVAMTHLCAEERFQRLFDEGCKKYTLKDLDAAYMAWNDAMLIATERNNREWMSVVSSNLQRLSYELLVCEGAAQVDRNELQEATKSFNLALEIATKARNAVWETAMHKALKQVQGAVFHRCHNAATQIFAQARAMPPPVVSADDYFVVPGTDTVVQHSPSFVREWSQMLVVREAVAVWNKAFHVACRVGGAEAATLRETVMESLTSVACFIVQNHFDQVSAVESLSLQGTADYMPRELTLLIELWTDIIAHVDQGMHHHLLTVVATIQVGHLYLATNQLPEATKQFATALEASRKLGAAVLEATCWTSCAILSWQRSDYGLAENQLQQAINLWKQLRVNNSSATSASSSPDQLTASQEKLDNSIPPNYVRLMHTTCLLYMVSTLTATYQYKEALECLEHTLITQYNDVLCEKMMLAFTSHPSADQVASISASLRTSLVYYLPTRRYEYNVTTGRYDVEWSMCVWIVPQGSDLRFIEVHVTKQQNGATLPDIIFAARRAMHVEPIEGADGIIADLHRKSWMEPLQALYTLCIDPVLDFIRVSDSSFTQANAVITVVPCGLAWLIPYHALLTADEQYLVETAAVQLVFSATQAAFAVLSAERVRQQDTRRSLVVVQGEEMEPTPEEELPMPYAPDLVRSLKEGEAILNVWRNIEEQQCTAKHTESVPTNSVLMVTEVETLRGLLSRARVIHFATSTTSTLRSSDPTGREHAGAIFMYSGPSGDDYFRASELCHVELFAELVALTVTNMNPTEVSGTGDNTLGLARSLFSGGTPCVILGQWCTPDMKPSEVFSKFYECQNRVASRSEDASKCVQQGTKVREGAPDTLCLDMADADEWFRHDEAKPSPLGYTMAQRANKAMSLALAIRAMLEDPAVRYCPRLWAGYYCVGSGYY